MPNRYYNETFSAALGSQARSAAFEAQFQAIMAGFDLLQSETNQILAQSVGAKFVLLSDCPATMMGESFKVPRVNAAGSALEFVTMGGLGIKVIAATAYPMVAGDAGLLLLFTAATPVTVTIPVDTFNQGDVVCIRQRGLGQVTVAPAAGVALSSSDSLFKTRKQHAQVALVFDDANDACLIGERDAPLSAALLNDSNIFTKAQTVAPVALVDAANIATDARLSNHFTVTLGGNRVLDNPSNLVNGVILNWKVKQDGAGNRTLAYGNKFKWAGGAAPALSTAANSRDYISAQYFADDDALLASILKGFA